MTAGDERKWSSVAEPTKNAHAQSAGCWLLRVGDSTTCYPGGFVEPIPLYTSEHGATQIFCKVGDQRMQLDNDNIKEQGAMVVQSTADIQARHGDINIPQARLKDMKQSTDCNR